MQNTIKQRFDLQYMAHNISTTYRSKKQVTRMMARCTQGVAKVYPRCTQALGRLMSMLRVWLEYAWSMPRVCLRYAYATPTSSRLTLDELTSHSRRDYVSLATSLRLVVTLLLMLVMGIGDVWGQEPEEPDYSGYYYIANYKKKENSGEYYSKDTPADNYYLCPAQYYYHSGETGANVASNIQNDTPFLTTNKTNHNDNSLWIIEKVKDENLYYIKHKGVGAEPDKYVVKNESLKNQATGAENDSRLRVHLEQIEDIDKSDKKSDAKFEITKYGSGDNIYYTIRINSITSAWLNPSKGNQASYVPSGTAGIGGMIGYYVTDAPSTDKGSGSRWCFEKLKCKATIITYDKSSNTVAITSDTEDANIYYTLDGETPNIPYVEPFEVTGNITIKAITTKSGYDDSEIASVRLVLNPTINLAQTVYTYSGSAIQPTVSSVKDGGTDIDVNEYTVSYKDNTDAGTAHVNIEDKAGDNLIVYGSKNFTINRKSVTITANDASKAYNGIALTESGFTTTALETGDTHTFTVVMTEGSTITNIGTEPNVIATVDGTAVTTGTETAIGNYLVTTANGTLTVNPKAVIITAKDASKAYDGTALTESGFTTTALETGDTHTFTVVMTEGSTITNIGTEPNVIATVDGTAVTTGTETEIGNYLVTTVNGTLTITPKPLTITAGSDTKVYDGTPLTKNSYTNTELMAGDHIERVTITGSQTNAGTSDNVPSAAIIKNSTDDDVTANYDITYTNGTLEVTKKTLTITADAKSKAYGEADPTLTYTAEGLINNDAITGTLSRETGENAGTYAITVGGLTAGDNYAISFTSANLTITKVGLKIMAKNHTITYGDIPVDNGVTYEGFVNGDTESSLGSIDYDFSYEQYGDVGNYTITPKGLTSDNYDITFVKGKLTVSPKKVGLTWSETTSFPYDGSPHAPTATATGLVNGDKIGVTVSGAETNAGNSHTATASALTGDKAGNYKLPTANKQSYTVTPKSLGDGTTLADGYTLNFGEGNIILLTDDEIGSALVLSTDYSVGEDTDPSEGYAIRTVTGIKNYTGSFTVRNAFVTFSTDTERDSWSATFVAEKKDEEDIGFVLPEGFSAFIISDIRGEWAIPEPLKYIPADVPVLLVANHQTQGFVVTEAESEKVTAITPDQKDKNMLEKVTEDTPGYNATTQSASFETKKIYLLYKNEFVFNKAGNLKKGKVYLNPNHTASSPEPAPARLMIAWNHTTGIKDEKWKMEDGSNERWYTLDGRCLMGKPTTKGLYIVNGKKTVIK